MNCYFENEISAICAAELCSQELREFWYGFTFGKSNITLLPTNEPVFLVGSAEPIEIPDGKRYTVNVCDDGVAVLGRDDGALMQGILAFLTGIAVDSPESPTPYHPHGAFTDTEDIGTRMVHLCVFPETSFDFMKKIIRFCGALRYTHVILEFWGMYRYQCMQELGWPEAFAKEQIKELVSLIRLLGMEPVPMFNHLGHASSARMNGGKHVVLDQNPTLAPFFGPDGWNWNIKSEEVLRLFAKVRAELYELFGEGAYFHLGVDECYLYGVDYTLSDELTTFLVRVCNEVLAEGRRPIIWGDMFLCHQTLDTKGKKYYCNCKDQRIADRVLSALDKRVVIADWQYGRTEGTLVTTPYFQQWGFDVICCPWEGIDNIKVNINTVRQTGALGVMETTWHTLSKGWHYLYVFAELCKAENRDGNFEGIFARPVAATLMRKVWPHFDGYKNTGWSEKQIDTSFRQ